MRAMTALAIFGLFLAPGIAAAQAPAGTAPSAPSSTMSPPPGTLQAPPATTATTKPPATTSTSHHSTATLAKYKTEADAKGACGSDPIVWANTSSKILHAGGDIALVHGFFRGDHKHEAAIGAALNGSDRHNRLIVQGLDQKPDIHELGRKQLVVGIVEQRAPHEL